ncbi:MAG: helix-turn-helix transcriptional regulator [Myxococcales bacterium FL481]|nr:MAG: helix-turn-helix transcriptional regulator [Myxococcales bacterium FL481]
MKPHPRRSLTPIPDEQGAEIRQVPAVESLGVAIGHFVCRPHSRRWNEDNFIRRGHVLAFPRRSLEIAQAGHRRVVAGPGQVMLYNRDQIYRRRLLDPRGDDCFFVGVPDRYAAAAIRERDPTVDEHPRRPFRYPRTRLSARGMLTLRTLIRTAWSSPVDRLRLEELLVQLLTEVTSTLPPGRDPTPTAPTRESTRKRHRELADTLERTLASRFHEPIGLEEIADAADASPFHAARVFRGQTGMSLHTYRTRLRLYAAAARLLDDRPRLADLAVDLGFASHSHFCDAFTHHFGCPPSGFRSRGRV